MKTKYFVKMALYFLFDDLSFISIYLLYIDYLSNALTYPIASTYPTGLRTLTRNTGQVSAFRLTIKILIFFVNYGTGCFIFCFNL